MLADWPMRELDAPSCDTRYQVFRDLRGRGFYLTSAGKFGGDFLVYPGQNHFVQYNEKPSHTQQGGSDGPNRTSQEQTGSSLSLQASIHRWVLMSSCPSSGDPLRFHAHFIALCLTLDESLPLLDVLAVARLGSNVKKTVLLCSPGTDRVHYTSVQWSGMV